MACHNPSITTRLRSAVVDWNQHLQSIKDPDDTFRQERARISDVSKKRIEEYYLNTLQRNGNETDNDGVALLLRSLLSDGQQIKELETEHEITRAKKQELQDEVAGSVGRRIVTDLIAILGLPTVQSLVSAVLPPPQGAMSTTEDYVDGASLQAPDDMNAPPVTAGLTTRSRTYSARNGRVRRKTTPSIGPSVTEGDSSLKRKRQAGDYDEQDIKQEKKTPRVSTRQTPSFAGKENSDSVSSLTTPCTRSGDIHQHSNETTVSSSRKGMKLQLKDIRLDVNRRSARVMFQRHPFRTDLGVCLVFFSPDHASGGLDAMVDQSFMPAFIQLVNRRRRTANDPEGPAALRTVQPPVDTHTSHSNDREREEEAVKKFENKKG
ncbi:hypothetical protein FPOAC2_14029 [Fusarium poae]|uniref:Uncharacterized protein n=1 Tax=Fusarium poae TaxID=36050 RepID=A0A1B8A4J4_FUSPO|nr:hypothetical protein FPOAC1_003922 [Fusarium poae]KAG8677894.1 hypothetical protein FPOAC1_003922 [Fusarium poae]OBS15401.1 hypothetical protein FPOA_13739 [Fusarium poae]